MKKTSTKKISVAKAVEIETEQKLKETSEKNKNQLQNIFQNAPAATAVYEGHEYKYILANKAYEKLSNRKAADLLGKNFSDVFPELEGTGAFELFDHVFETGETFTNTEYAVLVDIKNDGVLRQCYFNFSMEPIRNDLGKIYAVISMIYDITEQVEARKKSEESEKKFEAAILAVEGIIWTNNANGEMIGEQLGWANLTGQRFEEYQGYGWAKAIHIDDAQPTVEAWNNAVANRIPFKFEHRVNTKQHGWKLFSIKAIPVLDEKGTIQQWVGVHTDISKQREISEKLVETEKQQSFLLKLSDAIRPLNNPVKIEETVTKIAMDFLNADRCHYSTIEDDNIIILRDASRGNLPSIAGVYPISNFTLFKAILDIGRPFIVNDVHTTDLIEKELKQLCMQLQNISFINVPIIKNGKPVGLLSLVQSKPRKWTDSEVQLTIETAERTWAAVERAKAEDDFRKSEERLRLATQASDIYWWEFDFNTRTTLYAANTQQVMGVAPAKTLEENLLKLHHDDRKIPEQAFEEAIKNNTNHFNYVVRSTAIPSEIRWLQVTGRIIRDNQNNPMLAVGISQNITERKLFEKELMEAKVVAENATNSKQQFLSNMSHEIRTPLNSIIGFANVLLKTELGVEQKEFLQAIKTSGKSLNLLINDILDLAKVDAGKMTFEKQPFEIRKSIISLLHSFDLKIKEKNLEIIKEYDSKIPNMLLGDSLRLNQIILNLLSNAIKFTHKGKIILSVKLLHKDQEHVTLEFAVTDTGIGITADKIDSIFNVFEQAEFSTSNFYGGTGLGLAIVKQLIEVQGGSISVKSKLGEGSTFSFILPFGKTNIKLEEGIEIPKPDLEIKNLRVLVAEDVELNQLLIKIILSDFGFEYEIVNNGKMAIEKLQTNTYDIVLMDLQMPEMNGFEATKYIRKTLKSQIPIIALTADVTTVDVFKCKEFGMNDYISKPINEDLLYRKIVELAKKKS